MASLPQRQQSVPPALGTDLAGSLPIFPTQVGSTLTSSAPLNSLRAKQLLFNRLDSPGRIHIYRADCQAGERLRVQLLVPVLPTGGTVAPAMAVVAQSLPYSADVHKLPFALPAGYSAVVAPTPTELVAPIRDMLTRASYYPGPVIDTRTLVGGRCYVVVWSPYNHIGKYVVQLGYAWPWRWSYWLQVPGYWWQIRGWFGLSRLAAYVAAAALVGGALLARAVIRRRRRRARRAQPVDIGSDWPAATGEG
jgi:hypothetical protein